MSAQPSKSRATCRPPIATGPPQRAVLLEMVRMGIGQKLEALEEARKVSAEANSLRELAVWAGDLQSVRLIDSALAGVRVEVGG